MAIPFYYWTERRLQTTLNSQWPSTPPLVSEHRAVRDASDIYIRSRWFPHVSYYSDGTGSAPGWWGQAALRLVVSWDPEHLLDPSDINSSDPLTLGWMELHPTRWPLQDTPQHIIDWKPEQGSLSLVTARDGNGVVKPSVLGSLWYYDQYSYWGKSAETAPIIRAQMTSRVLWGSNFES